MSRVPVSALLVLLPALLALAVGRARGVDAQRRAAAWGNGAVTLLALAAAAIARGRLSFTSLSAPFDVAWRDASPSLLGLRVALGFDPLAALALPALAATVTAVLVAAPRRSFAPGGVALLLLKESATFGMLLALDGAGLFAAWSAAAWAGWRAMRGTPHARAYGILVAGSTAPLAAALALLGVAGARAGLALPLDFESLARAGLPHAAQAEALGFLALAVMVRTGVVPFHAWLHSAFASPTALPAVTAHLAAPVGLAVLLRVALPALPHAAHRAMPLLEGAGWASAVLAALLGLVQQDLRRAVLFVRTSQASLTLAGAATATAAGVTGAALQSVVIAVAIPALLMVLASLESRRGGATAQALAGVVRSAPAGVALYALLSVGTAGFPGTLGLVGEDFLLRAAVAGPAAGVVALIAVTALNGVTLLRGLFGAMCGEAPEHLARSPVPDLAPRERVPPSLAFAVLVVTGLMPGPLVLLEGHLAPTHEAPAPGTTARPSARGADARP